MKRELEDDDLIINLKDLSLKVIQSGNDECIIVNKKELNELIKNLIELKNKFYKDIEHFNYLIQL